MNTNPLPIPPPTSDPLSIAIARARWERDTTAWLREHLKARVGRRQLAALTRIADAYAERCEQFAVEQETRPIRAQLADARSALDTCLENKCPKCGEFLHPRAARCGTCSATVEREVYTKQLLSLHEDLTATNRKAEALRRHVELAIRALERGKHEKKKGQFLRQALAILEAAISDAQPSIGKGGIGFTGMIGALAYAAPLMGSWIANLKRDAKTKPGATPETSADPSYVNRARAL